MTKCREHGGLDPSLKIIFILHVWNSNFNSVCPTFLHAKWQKYCCATVSTRRRRGREKHTVKNVKITTGKRRATSVTPREFANASEKCQAWRASVQTQKCFNCCTPQLINIQRGITAWGHMQSVFLTVGVAQKHLAGDSICMQPANVTNGRMPPSTLSQHHLHFNFSTNLKSHYTVKY